jgi:hypothetical protein
MATQPVESGGETAYAGNASLEVCSVALGAAVRVRGESRSMVRIPVRRMLAGIRVDDRLLVRAAASRERHDEPEEDIS